MGCLVPLFSFTGLFWLLTALANGAVAYVSFYFLDGTGRYFFGVLFLISSVLSMILAIVPFAKSNFRVYSLSSILIVTISLSPLITRFLIRIYKIYRSGENDISVENTTAMGEHAINEWTQKIIEDINLQTSLMRDLESRPDDALLYGSLASAGLSIISKILTFFICHFSGIKDIFEFVHLCIGILHASYNIGIAYPIIIGWTWPYHELTGLVGKITVPIRFFPMVTAILGTSPKLRRLGILTTVNLLYLVAVIVMTLLCHGHVPTAQHGFELFRTSRVTASIQFVRYLWIISCITTGAHTVSDIIVTLVTRDRSERE